MKEISMEEYKRLSFEMLRDFADFCDSHQLTYYIAYGTLIGAVRHHGFIPWDDDIDTWMPRRDYDKFLKLYAEFGMGKYILHAPELNPKYGNEFAKLELPGTVTLPSHFMNGYLFGVNIDIFPLDSVGKGDDIEATRMEYLNFKKQCAKIISQYYRYSYASGVKKLLKIAAYRFAELRYGPLETHFPKFARILADNNPDEYNFYVTLAGDTLFRKEWFRERVKLDFESAQFWAPADYDAILRTRYGDYMEYPPENKRVPSHAFKAYYLDDGEMESANVPRIKKKI